MNELKKLADELREILGIGSDTTIEIVTPQFERSSNEPAPGAVPTDWEALRSMSVSALKEMGLGVWGDENGFTLMLLPGEWHRHIPEGFQLESISGKSVVAGQDYIDDDIRFGCLAYGIIPIDRKPKNNQQIT